MIDYNKVNLEYAKIHARLDELEEKSSTNLLQRKVIDPIDAAAGLPLQARCFLLYRAYLNSDLIKEFFMDSADFMYTIIYLDPYELPTVGRRIFITFDEMGELWKEACPVTPWADRKMGWLSSSLFEAYLKKEGYL